MGTVADKLARLQETKRAIRGALEEKGQPVADGDSFASYAEKLRAIDTGETARPADWLTLPDVSNAETETIVMLLHIPPAGISEIGFYFEYSGDTTLEPTDSSIYPAFQVDWGDGNMEDLSVFDVVVMGESFGHIYDYSTLDAPTTKSGEKQLIVRLKNTSTVPFTGFFNMDNDFYLKDDQLKYHQRYNHPTILRDMKVACPPPNNDFSVNLSSPVCLWGFEGHNVYEVGMSSSSGLRHFCVTGDNYRRHSISGAYQCREMDIPDNAYIYFFISNSLLSEIDIDASESTNLGLSNMSNLRKMKLRGCTKPFSLSFSKMDREAFIELFESLGTVTTTTNLRVTSSSGYRELTDEDKAIARNKGWTLT